MSDRDFVNYNVVTDGTENETESLSVYVVKIDENTVDLDAPVEPEVEQEPEKEPAKPATKKRSRKE